MDATVTLFTKHDLTSTAEEIKSEIDHIRVSESTSQGSWPIVIHLGDVSMFVSLEAARKLRFELAATLHGMDMDSELTVVSDD